MRNFGNYILLKKIATGGMAELYKARKGGEAGFAKLFAAKMVLPHLAESEEFVAMLVDEAKVAAHLDHKNIVRIHDLIKAGGSCCIIMEYVRGKDLRRVLARAKKTGIPLAVGDACVIVSSLLEALSYAHSKRFKGVSLGIVHRDVSPQNILISYEGEVKLADFGIARAANRQTDTKTGVLKGKFAYMSPEQARGKAVDARSDLFSLGSVFYEMLTGKKLFSGDSDIGTLRKVWAAKVEPRPSELNVDVSPRLEEILLKALSKEPGDRYESADAMRDALIHVVRSERIKAAPSLLGNRISRLFRQEMETELREDDELLEWHIEEGEFLRDDTTPEGGAQEHSLPQLVPEAVDYTAHRPRVVPPPPLAKSELPAKAAKYAVGSAALLFALAGIFYSPAPQKPLQDSLREPVPAIAPEARKRVSSGAGRKKMVAAKPVKVKEAISPENARRKLGQAVASISSNPAGALVYVEDIYVGRTPLEFRDIEDGKEYTVKVIRAGYEKWTGSFTGRRGVRKDLLARLKKEVPKNDFMGNMFPKSPSSQQP